MQKFTALALVAMVLVGTVGLVPFGAAAQSDNTTATEGDTDVADSTINDTANDSDEEEVDEADEEDENETAPGTQLSGVVEVQKAELDGEVEEREFGIKVAQAATQNDTAAVVGERLEQTEEEVAELEEEKEELKEEYEAGNISEAEYKSEMAAVEAKANHLERMANESGNVSDGLPEETLEANGVNVTAIQTLKQDADNMSGQEVSEIAQQIAGNNVGDKVPGNASDKANDRGNGNNGADDRGANGNNETADRPDNAGNNATDGQSGPDRDTTDGDDEESDEETDNTTEADDQRADN